MLRKTIAFVILFVVLSLLLFSPKLIGIDDWQRKVLEWNYFGAIWNYILFFIAVYVIRKKDLSYYGLKLGLWRKNLHWFLLCLFILIGFTKLLDFMGSHHLALSLPSASTIIFQLVFIAYGEDFVWRGLVQKEFGMILGAFGFGLMHASPMLWGQYSIAYAAQYFAFTFLMGLLLGWVRKKTESVYASGTLHGIYNLINNILVAT
ncbi:CPBP family intramembrane glutamic endopeptidase [Paenibacillus sediminis]|uniref:Membrane protease YdiL (CAAX protease family) n=1 Tax=Paenibacillus sediminis TaxID=664909 RepID=A0ABS4H6F0_9BACL|nr:CPBP family intramembrane glutamic endopeptidase [Paenibacillus sediminis]MBP1938100.1 membrane protease YdiL (CAAX protease family) [Paenibacillus sediminis]